MESNPSGWVVIDEVQKAPAVLDEVHGLISKYGDQLNFAISGSSARKLKRMDANLLAGRAINTQLFPLSISELDFKAEPETMLRFGSLPRIQTLLAENEQSLVFEVLESYVANYLREEIQQEALTRNLGSFSRFLRVAAIMNGQIVNFSQTASDAGVTRPTVTNYFEILQDTLVGTLLPCWQPRAKVKQKNAHPRFYFFDCGVVRTITTRLRDSLAEEERGRLLETLVLNELRVWRNFSRCGGEFYYWRSDTDVEVDFIWQRGEQTIAIEVKATTNWSSKYSKAMRRLLDRKQVNSAYGIYLGGSSLIDGEVKVFGFKDFVRALHAGEIFK